MNDEQIKLKAINNQRNRLAYETSKHTPKIKRDTIKPTIKDIPALTPVNTNVPTADSHPSDIISRLQTFKANRADILADLQLQVIDAINNQDLRATPTKDLASLFKISYDAERLERGMSTGNIDILSKASDIIARKRLGNQSAINVQATIESDK